MKIVHVSTLIKGGAARATIRLHNNLLEQGLDSTILHLQEEDNSKKIKNAIQFVQPKKRPTKILQLKKRIFNKFGYQEKNILQENSKILEKLRQIALFDIFTFPITPYRIHEHPAIKNADIIHLHWIANFLDYKSFFKNVKKPIVWTFHDRNPFLGGVHLELDYFRNNNNFKKIDEKYRKIKYSAVKKSGTIRIISPSKSLANEIPQRKIFKSIDITVIPNSIEEEFGKRLPVNNLRNELKIPQNFTTILFVGSIAYHKGFDLLLQVMRRLKNEKIFFLIVGIDRNSIDTKELMTNVKYFGTLKDDVFLSNLYQVVDGTVITSREDNLPNVMLESWSCGTPVISTPIGGMRDNIIPNINGLLSKDSTDKSLAETIMKFVEKKDNFLEKNILRFFENNFSSKKQLKSYLEIYNIILEKSKSKLGF